MLAETDVQAQLIPTPVFERLLCEPPAFRRLVLKHYAERVADLVILIPGALFHAAPQRLARLLIADARRRCGDDPPGARRRTLRGIRALCACDVRMTVSVAFPGRFSLANSPESLYSACARLAGEPKTALTIRRSTLKEP